MMTKSSRSPRESLTTLAFLGLVAAVLSGCQAQQTTRNDTQATTATAAAETPTEDAKAMERAGFQAMTGRWAGKWDYGETSTLTVGGEGPDAMTVEYCYADECWNVTEAEYASSTIKWTSRGGWRFEFKLKNEKIRGKLRNQRGTTRIKMSSQ